MFQGVFGVGESDSEVIAFVRHRIGGGIRTPDPIAEYIIIGDEKMFQGVFGVGESDS
jgi:hypothetical protein